MILWHARKLAHAFREGELSERQQFSYLLFYILITYVISDTYLMEMLQVGPANEMDLLITIFSLAIVTVGTWICFKTSQRNPTQNGFISRYICLGIPVLIRVLVYIILAVTLVGICSVLFSTIPAIESYFETESTTMVDVVLSAGAEIFYFYYLNLMIDESYT